MHFADRMAAAVRKTGSITCVGLDPRQAQLPAPIRDAVRNQTLAEWAEAYQRFCCEIIDAGLISISDLDLGTELLEYVHDVLEIDIGADRMREESVQHLAMAVVHEVVLSRRT